LIVVEDLNIKGLAKSNLAKQINDVAWGGFLSKLAYKAESAGRVFVKVNPRNTSQNCSDCGLKVEKSLSVRVHKCHSCGLALDRDHNAAINILRLGNSLQAQTKAVELSVA
jgi:putative transposase